MAKEPKTALVIGGTRRVGRWVSEALLIEGHRVHAVHRQDAKAASQFAGEMKDSGYSLHTLQADVTNEQQAKDAVAAVAEAEGGIGILVNCAGPAASGSIVGASGEELERIWRGNVLGVHHVTAAAVPYLRLQGGGIVNFLSAGVEQGKAFRDVALYAACKAMLLSYSRSLARELAPAGITVNCIALGISELPAEGAPAYKAGDLPTGRAVDREDVAAAIWYLTGPAASQVTGTVVNLGGGFGL